MFGVDELEDRVRRRGRIAALPGSHPLRGGGVHLGVRGKLRRVLRGTTGPVGRVTAGLDERDVDAERRDFLRERFGKAFERPLRCVIQPDIRKRHDPADARHRDDVTALLFAHDRQHGLRDPERAEEVRLHLLARFRFRDFLDGAEAAVSGVIDQDVDPAESLLCGRDRFEHRVPIVHVEGERENRVAERVRECRNVARLPRRRDDPVSAT